MKKLCVFLASLLLVSVQLVQAQTVRITGTVTSSEDGMPLPGVSVIVKGTTIGGATDASGKYEINAPADAQALTFSFVGFKVLEVAIAGRAIIDVVLQSESVEMQEVVVTALGITREKKALGYATQEVKGDAIATVKSDNFVNSISGKVSGVQVKRNTNFGGSTNIIIRGNKSITGDNQALFVIDGVPVSNTVANTTSQSQAGLGYDYGNAAADLNPEDIESINVLKGAAASALYGSRASNGVIMITTKKGSKKDKGLGVTVNSGITIGMVDKNTFPEYQKKYGGGYGMYYEEYDGDPDLYFWNYDIDGDGTLDQVVPLTEDASWGAAFDENLLVYQWDAFYTESPNYMTRTPYVAAKNGPIEFFETPISYSNSISIDNAFENGSYRLGYSNIKQNGILPNSELIKNNFTFSGDYKVNKKFTVSGFANFIRTEAEGRNSTGYSDNIMGSFRQWYQVNVDIKQQKKAYFDTRRNITWNWSDISGSSPIYWDNPYWTRYENYESDERNRFIGNMTLKYKLTDWLDILGRASVDTWSGLQEERRNVGSVAAPFGIGTSADGSGGRDDQQSGYLRKNLNFSEYNYDLMINFNKDITDKINVRGLIGTNIRRTNYEWVLASTSGGLGIPGLYALQNSVSAVPFPKESDQIVAVNGIMGSLQLSYDNFLFLDGSLRRDHSSTLPKDNSVYYYPSIAGSFLFSKFVPGTWLSHGKIRVNYAGVGNSALFDQISDTYVVNMPLNAAITSVANTKKNPDLKPEFTKSIEAGLEMNFLNNRVGFDLAFYKTNTVDQIIPLAISESTGYLYKMVNAGEVEDKGIELSLHGTPVKIQDFSWDITLNWTKSKNEVISLSKGFENIQLGSFQGGVTINAKPGQPYGVIEGTDYTYLNGKRVINASNGRYIPTTTSDNVIGDINPDWHGGIFNKVTYKNISLSFLIDIQKGGDIFSLDMYYGLATGLYKETAVNNDLGNPVRDPIVGTPGNYDASSGGFINKGVNPDGSVNQTRISCVNYGAYGYARGLPNKAFVYDASYVKLREVALTYDLPTKFLAKTFIKQLSLSFVGSNLWIIHKNLPYADPESGLGAGNLQGYSIGSLPSTKDFGFNVKLQF